MRRNIHRLRRFTQMGGWLLALLLAPCSRLHAQVISALPTTSSASGGDYMALVQSGTTKKITVTNLFSSSLDPDLLTYAAITPSANVQSFLGAADNAAMRSLLGLVIGTNVQAYDAELAALAGLTSAADKGIYFTGSVSAATFDLTSTARTLLDDTSTSAMRTTLGLAIGTDVQAFRSELLKVYTAGSDIASSSSIDLGAASGDYVNVTGTTTITSLGTATAGIERTVNFTGILTLTHNATSLILPGGASITTAAGDTAIFRSLGSGNWKCVQFSRPTWGSIAGTLSNQTDLQSALNAKQAADADLTIYAGITPSANVQSFLGAADYAAMRTQLGLVIGTNVQAWRSELDKENLSATDLASASTVDIGAATGDYVSITGTNTITSFGTAAAGVERTVRFTGALTLTHNASTLILPGAANITTANGDVAEMRSQGSGVWRCTNYSFASGAGSGSVNSVSMSSGTTFLTISGSPVTTSGTITINLGSAALPIANGGTGATNITGLVQANGSFTPYSAVANSTTVGQVLRVTASNTYGWGALDLTNANATTGVLRADRGGAGSQTITAPTGTTATIDWASGNLISINLGSASGNVTLTLNNPIAGQSMWMIVTQGATARQLAFPAGTKQPAAGGTTWTSSGANQTDVISLIYDGTNYRILSTSQNQG
jgi:hypothetical protein